VGRVRQYRQLIKRLDREFFSIEVNKSVILVVNRDEGSEEATLERSEMNHFPPHLFDYDVKLYLLRVRS